MSSTEQDPFPTESNGTQSAGGTQGRTSTSRRRQQRTITTKPTSYCGQYEDIGCIFALRSEQFDKKIQFQAFMEKMSNYVVSNLKDSGDIQCLYTDLKDPTDEFQLINKPIKPAQDNFVALMK